IVAPTAFHALAKPEAETATARAAAATDTPFCLSTLSTTGVAELASGAPEARRWFQLYVFKDRGVTREMVSAAVDNGYEALVLTGADALPAVVDEVGDELDVLVDGGIRRGTDVLKALALGARAVLVGRPVLWGLAVGGEQGVRRVLELLLADLDAALALVGAPRAAELDRSWIQPGPWANT